MEKTLVMKILDKHNIPYTAHSVDNAPTDAIGLAKLLNVSEQIVFKTLVTVSQNKTYYVFVVPSSGNLDLKKAANSVNEKKIELIPLKELFPLTGYVHGGCSPIGMKKKFETVIDISATNFENIILSAGKVGYQIEINPTILADFINAKFYDIKN